MSEMMATANAKSIEEIKSFLSRQKEVYKIPYETHPADRPRQCVFGGTSNALDFLPLDRSGNGWFCGGHRTDGASILKMTARCTPCCYPVAGLRCRHPLSGYFHVWRITAYGKKQNRDSCYNGV